MKICSTRFAMSAILFSVPLVLGCGSSGNRPVVVSGNQGSYVVQEEKNPMDSRPRASATAAQQTGPTAREVEQQRRIEELENRQKALQGEIDRLKAEQLKGK